MHTQIRSPAAVLLGSICVTATIIVLFGHIRHLDDLTLTHLYIMVALVVTLGSGHFMWDAFSDGPLGILRGLCLLVLFIVGTIVCVGLSGGRSAAIIVQRDKDAEQATSSRAALIERITKQQTIVDSALTDYTDANITATKDETTAKSECISGKGKICDGKQLSAQTSRQNANTAYQRHIDEKARLTTLESELTALPPPSTPNEDLASFAMVWSHISGKTFDEAMADVKLFMPYALALLTEFGAIIFLKQGFGPPQYIPPPAPAPQSVTIAEIAYDLKLPVHVARRKCRDAQIPKPSNGWVWPFEEAQKVKLQIASTDSIN